MAKGYNRAGQVHDKQTVRTGGLGMVVLPATGHRSLALCVVSRHGMVFLLERDNSLWMLSSTTRFLVGG